MMQRRNDEQREHNLKPKATYKGEGHQNCDESHDIARFSHIWDQVLERGEVEEKA
jgi:hypothetical protein